MKNKIADLKAGETFGHLTILCSVGRRGHNVYYECRCACGKISAYQKYNLLSGNSQSCGCLKGRLISLRRTVHGHAGRNRTKEYRAWKHAKGRCYTPTDEKYPQYGARGIRMCDEWLNDFQAFFDYMGPAPVGMTLDRVNNDGHYEPGNVRWATSEEQANNKQTTIRVVYAGKQMSLSQAARCAGISIDALWRRVRIQGEELHKAITTLQKAAG